MFLEDFHFLLSDSGIQWLAKLSQTKITPQNHLQIASRLRKQLPAPQAQAVIETAVLRQRAAVKFSKAAQMFFTRPALEQASSEIVASYRAQRFQQAGIQTIADLGCSIGGDALALAAFGEVTGVEWDPVRLSMAQENVRVYGGGERFHPLQADLMTLTPLSVDGLFFDPARRDERGRRFFSVHQYQPPLRLIDVWREIVPETAVKVSPGVDYDELPSECELEFISLNGGVKEGVLWFGNLQSGVRRRATLLPGPHSLTDLDLPDAIAVTKPKRYLYEPDGAVIRAHLVEALAKQLQATKLNEMIAYLTADTAEKTPFARCFMIEDVFPFQLKRLRRYLSEKKIGKVTIKKRGAPMDPDTLRQQLRLNSKHPNQCILFLTHIEGETAVLVCQDVKL